MPKPAKTTDPRRNADLAMIHMAAKHLFGDTGPGGADREAYEDWLERHCGQRSAGTLTRDQRIALIKVLRRDGLIPERARGGGGRTAGGHDRPTAAQWGRIGGLARSLGWNGLDDARLSGFVKRTVKLASPRFMTRQHASQVILGLEEWTRQQGVALEPLNEMP